MVHPTAGILENETNPVFLNAFAVSLICGVLDPYS